MSKTLILVLTTALMLSVFACGGSDEAETSEPSTPTPTRLSPDDTPVMEETATRAVEEKASADAEGASTPAVSETAAPQLPVETPTPNGGSIPQTVTMRTTATATSTGQPPPHESTVTPEAVNTVVVTTPEAEPAETEDCGSFATFTEAQRFFIASGGPDSDDYGLDTNSDGIACNAPSDRGYESITFATVNEATAVPVATVTATVPDKDCSDFATWQEALDFFISEGGPDSDPHSLDADRDGVPCTALKHDEENPPSPTPTFPPAEPADDDVWSSEERSAELNSINWHAFRSTRLSGFRQHVKNGVSSIAAPGEVISVPAKDEKGMPTNRTERVDCAERFGNRLDDRNPSFYEKRGEVWLWIEPTDGGEPFCVNVDRYRNWLESDPEPLPEPHRTYSFPRAHRLEPLVFTDPVNGPREHTLPPLLSPDAIHNFQQTAIGKTFEIPDTGGTELECAPQNVPVAVWTLGMGFEVLSREEEELLARYALSGGRFQESASGRKWWQHLSGSEDPDEREQFLQSYDWESKESWRDEGWFLAIIGEPYERKGINEHWRNDVTYSLRTGIDDLVLAACWQVWNTEDLPPPRYCLECERRANMERMAAGAP